MAAGSYNATFGMFDQTGKLIYELLFSFVLLPTSSQQGICTSNDDFMCTFASQFSFPPDVSGWTMIEVMGWVSTNITVMEVGVKLYDLNSSTEYNWQNTTTNDTYTQAEPFFYAPWFSLTGMAAGSYNATFGMFDQTGKLIYELLFSFVLVPTNSQQGICTSNDDFLCTFASQFSLSSRCIGVVNDPGVGMGIHQYYCHGSGGQIIRFKQQYRI